ncbi:hypothetical protein LEP1GSC052_2452 [Leptospira kmetyi serovar Malaysia str. Bejo-Iso9]|nr:hypothetical protein LEP1GSC052_2452 [Leptospira kmetyi serovar Malaysia str. Bejo-Iso9]
MPSGNGKLKFLRIQLFIRQKFSKIDRVFVFSKRKTDEPSPNAGGSPK